MDIKQLNALLNFLSHLCGGKFEEDCYIGSTSFLSHLCGGK
ncbi:hypothetical protein [uncultured Gammaproteobacteria bacterium]|nr:hypothetical protein [uncultured Gammaproteobacteria bacterium]